MVYDRIEIEKLMNFLVLYLTFHSISLVSLFPVDLNLRDSDQQKNLQTLCLRQRSCPWLAGF